jgi:hypothetical protein
VIELRYEQMTRDPGDAARTLAAELQAPADALAAALGRAHRSSIGRYRDELTDEQLADVVAEAGDLLRELGYLED